MQNLRSFLNKFSRKQKLFVLLFADMITAFSCWFIFGPPLASVLIYNFNVDILQIVITNIHSFIIPFLVSSSYFIYAGFYRSLVRFFDSTDKTFHQFLGCGIFGFTWALIFLIDREVLTSVFILKILLQGLLLSAVYYAFLSLSRDIAKRILHPYIKNINAIPLMIYGAGAAGNELYQALLGDQSKKVIAFYDNSINLKGGLINNIPILGKDKHIERLKFEYPQLEVLLAIPSLNLKERRKIISSLEKFKVSVRSVPSLHEMVADQKIMSEFQDLSIDDLLPRERIQEKYINFSAKSILISGAGGSIGSEIVRQVAQGNPRKIVLFELSELNLFSIQEELNSLFVSLNVDSEIIPILGDIKNEARLLSILKFHQIDIIYHAAAYKHVPIVEYEENISVGVENNIFGTLSVCNAAERAGIESVVVISTDKAVRPTNVMGASKRFAEMIVQSANANTAKTKFCMVRFGNVLNSSGSVIPLFRRQIASGGPLTITDKRITRYFMTIAEASNLVIQAGNMSIGGEVFLLDMGEQVKIIDLAKKLIYLSGRNISNDQSSAGIRIEEIGLRPGEKLYEELLISGKELRTSNDKIFMSNESFPLKEDLESAKILIKDCINTNDSFGIKKILTTYIEGYNNDKSQG
jgi:FlaA1/EpsC-like NDP-sugar epimerase